MEEKDKKQRKILFIIIGIVLVLIGGCIGFVIGNSFAGNDNKNEQKNENNGEKEIDIDSELVKKLYNMIHYDTEAACMTLSREVYREELFEVKNIELITFDLSEIIYDKTFEEVKDKVKKADGINYIDDYIESKYLDELIEKEFYNIFGDNLKFKKELFSTCNRYFYGDGVYLINVGCGDTCVGEVYYDIYKATTSNDYLYIYENVKIEWPGLEDMMKEENYKYKWTFNKDKEGNYHLLKAERI